nr:hypothetical protein [Angustibacter aerolatus]
MVAGDRAVDPRTGRPARPTWRSVAVGAGSARAAASLARAAVLLGDRAPVVLAARGASARLVALDGRPTLLGEALDQPADASTHQVA